MAGERKGKVFEAITQVVLSSFIKPIDLFGQEVFWNRKPDGMTIEPDLISRQGRKFGVGLTVVSQQVTAIDEGILPQINTELTMALGNEEERRAAVRNASADLTGFERELQVMSKGQAIASTSYRDIPLPVQVPNYDELN
jgi:DNA helicase HerA-like ATPase